MARPRTEAQKKSEVKFKEGKKKLAVYVSLDIDEQFTEKLKQDKLTKQDVLETAVYQYINGELRVNKTK